jgi:hypothetical protein
MAADEFTRDTRVLFDWEGQRHRGRITEVLNQRRRVVTDSGKRLLVPVRRLRLSPDRVLILETRLDRTLRSTRSYGPMLQQWLSAYRAQTLYERVHTVEAMRKFLRQEGRNVATRFIHIQGHGTDNTRKGKATLHLTFERLSLLKHPEVFAGLAGKILIFSCCEVGGNRRAMEAVKDASGAAAVIGYRVEVDDVYTNLSEVLLYDRLISTNTSPRKAVELANAALALMGTKVEDTITRKPVLVCA